MADEEVLKEIHSKYVPFLKKLIAFLEKTKKASPDNLNRLKNIQTVFASSPKTEQIEIFKANKIKLERWFNSSQKDKTSADNTRGKRSKVVIEDSDSSQGESIQAKRPRIEETVQNSIDDAKPTILVQNEKTDTAKVIQPGQIIKVTRTIEVQPPVKTSDPVVQSASSADPVVQPASRAASSSQEKILFSCASCQYQSYEENEFMKHTRADHRSDLSMWCKECGKCFSNAGVLISHIKDKQCLIEDMTYRCGVKDCDFETDNGQTFVHHLRHCHKGSPFIFCVHCQKIFTLPHCLILHMQDDCPHKERNRKNDGTVKTKPVQAPKKPTLPPVPAVISKPQTLTPTPKPITMVNYSVPRAATPSTVKTPPSSIGRGALMPTARGRARGRGRSRLPSYSSDSDDPDDPSWKPEEATGTQTLRRSGRWAKKVNDAVNVESSQTSKSLSMAELNNKEMLDCPCCDFMAAFKSVLQDHYIAQHKVPNKNACLVCHLKFEATQGFLDHFEDHANGKLSNKMVTDVEDIPSTTSKNNLKTYGKSNLSKNSCEASNPISIDKESIQGVVKNLSEINVVNSESEQSQYVKIPYQVVVNDNNLKDNTPKRFEELKSQNDLVIILNNIYKLKCFFKCPLCNCSYATNDSNEFTKHMEAEHPPEKKLHCGYCLKESSSPSLLTEHLLIEHSRRRYQCNKCFYRGFSKIHVQIHIKNYHATYVSTEVIECDPVTVPPNIEVKEESNEILNYTWPYVCALGSCDFKTYDPKEFKSHNEMTHRSVSLFFCHYCKVDFLSVKRLLSHYRFHGINTYQCSYCIYGSEIRDDILLHVCNSHADYPLKAFMRGSEEDIPAEEKQLPYSLNSEVSRSNSVDSDELNVETDTNGVDFENQMYEVVGKTYYPKYTENICSHLVCGIPGCVEKFDNLLIYIGHLKNFHAAENFTCPHCSDVSDTWEEFKNHLMCHGSALYACGLVTCNFYDWDKNVVTNHLNNHLKPTSKVVIVREPADIANDKSDVSKVKSLPESCPFVINNDCFQCVFCKYKSFNRNVMKNHIYLELRYKRFCCSACNEKYVSRNEIKEHYTEKHSNEDIKFSLNPHLEIEAIVHNILEKKIQCSFVCQCQCSNCKKHFKSVVQFQQHMCLCTQKCYEPYICSYCNHSFSCLKILKFHVDEKHMQKPVVFFKVSSIMVEEEIDSKIQVMRLKYLKSLNEISAIADSSQFHHMKFYSCSACSFESNHKYNTQMHIEKAHKNSNAEVNKVLRKMDLPELATSNMDDNSNDSLKVSEESSNSVKRYRCGFCIKKLPTLQELESHVESLHPVYEEVEYSYYYTPDIKSIFMPDDKELFECSYCKSGKENLHSLKKHSDLMHSESQFKVRGYVNRSTTKAGADSSIIACGYCYQRLDNKNELKRHIKSQHPSLPQKSIGGFKNCDVLKKSLEEFGALPDKKVKLGSLVFVCSHCGAAYSKPEQVKRHCLKVHARLKPEFVTINTVHTNINFYKCEFCQFTAEKHHLDLHLENKHTMRVICGYCNRQFEFATKLREHHDLVHKGLPVKYSQETLDKKKILPKSAIKQEQVEMKSSQKPLLESFNSIKDPDSTALESIFTYDHSESCHKISVLSFSRMHNIFPKVLLKDVMK